MTVGELLGLVLLHMLRKKDKVLLRTDLTTEDLRILNMYQTQIERINLILNDLGLERGEIPETKS